MSAIIIALPAHEPAGAGADPVHADARERHRGRPVLAWAINDASGRPSMRWLISTAMRECSGDLAA